MVRFLRGACLSAAVVIGVLSCGGGGGGSTPTTPNPPPPASPTLTSLTVTAPSPSARVGESAQFTATALMSNATSQTVTSQASWQSSNGSVATVSNTGMVAAVGPGVADIRATYQTVSGSAQITVTAVVNSLCGTVRSSTTNATLGGAEIEILSGPNAGLKVTADANGAFCLNNLQTGTITVRIRRNDYNATDQTVVVNGATIVTFLLTPTSSPNPNPNPNPTPNPNPNPNMQCDAAAYPRSASCGTPSAVCNDGSLSCSANRQGTCSSHNGVKCWLCPGTLCNGLQMSEPYYSAKPLPWDKR